MAEALAVEAVPLPLAQRGHVAQLLRRALRPVWILMPSVFQVPRPMQVPSQVGRRKPPR